MTLLGDLSSLLGKGSPNLDALARFLETEPDQTQRLLDVSLPALLGGLALRTQSDSGANAVFGLVSGLDGAILRDVDGFLNEGDPLSIGSSLVGSVLGRRRNHVEQRLAAVSGVGVGSVAKFLPALAPLVLSFLGGKATGGGLNAGGLASVLDENFASMRRSDGHEVLDVLGGVPTDVASADTSFLSSLRRVAGLGGLGVLAGTGTPAALASMPSLATAAAPSQFRQYRESDASPAGGDGPGNRMAPADDLVVDVDVDEVGDVEAVDGLVADVDVDEVDDVEAADDLVVDVDVDEVDDVEAAVEVEDFEVEDVDAPDGDAADEVDAHEHVEAEPSEAAAEDEAAATASIDTSLERSTVDIAGPERRGPGWLKWLLPLLLLGLIALLVVSVLNRGTDEIVGNDLGGRSVTIGVQALPDGATRGAGWDFDLWHEVCDVIDCKAEFVVAPWPGVLDQVASGEIETAINDISITEERESYLDFSDPYVKIEQKMVVAGSDTLYASTDDVIGDQAARIGAESDTLYYELAQSLVPEDRIATFTTLDAVMGAVVDGDVDAAVFADVAGLGYVGEGAEQLRVVDGTFGVTDLGFVFPPGSEYIGPVNHAIAELKADGRLDELARQYRAAR